MDIYASDEEKGEVLKQWWRDNGRSVIFVVLLSIASVFGGRYWMAYQQTQTETAAMTYQKVLLALANNEVAAADDETQVLLSQFSSTPYAAFAALRMAKQTMEAEDIAGTKSYLEWVIAHAQLNGQVAIARLRLAKILLHEAEYEPAILALDAINGDAFSSLVAEVRGDIFVAQGLMKQANTAYQRALKTVNEGDRRVQLLNFKLDDTVVSKDA